MRNEHLKQKLDKIPQGFDRDELWAAIDKPKKRKKRGIIFWIFGFGSAALLLIWINRNERGCDQE